MSLPNSEFARASRGERPESEKSNNSSAATGDAATTDDPLIELSVMADVVLEHHRELDRTAQLLRTLSVYLRDGRPSAPPGPARLIEEFEDQLIPHFAAEEAEEFFGSLVTDQPRLLRRVEQLQVDHGEMAAAVEELIEFARTEPPPGKLGLSIERFLDRFDAHERAENELMQEFLLLEVGGSG